MSATKILWGQIVTVLLIVLTTIWGATQWTASALGVGAQVGGSELVRAVRQGASDTINQTGQQIVSRQLNVQPTLTIRPGYPVRVIVTHDLVLVPVHSGER